MKITNVNGSKTAGSAKRKKSDGGSGSAFAEKLRDAAGGEGAAPGVSGPGLDGISGILALQEVGDATDDVPNRGRAMLYGEDVLDRLSEIQDGILTGTIAKDDLVALAQNVRAGRGQLKDERLNTILDEIELRAEVEIAKLTRERNA